MSPHSSSTSSSEPLDRAEGGKPTRPGRRDLRESLTVGVWLLLFLVAADVAIDRLFRLPDDPRIPARGALRSYFNYGWSIEAKLRHAIAPTDEASAPLMGAGWVDALVASCPPVPKATPDDRVLTIYGMSFSNHLGEAVRELDPRYHPRLLAGPAASANHSYAVYRRDRGGPARVVILGVLASSVPGLITNNGATWRFESPAPYTYPRYIPGPSGLEERWPSVRTLDDFRARLADPSAWRAYLDELAATDGFYNDALYRRDPSDRSSIGRLIRRAMAQRWQSAQSATVHEASGFVEESPAIASLRGIVSEFAASVRADGKRPIVVLIEDRGYRDHLWRVLGPLLTREEIPNLATHTLCPDSDPRNFIPDGHFTPEANGRLAKALLEIIERERSALRGGSGPAPIPGRAASGGERATR